MPILINIFGPSTAGKTTTTNLLLEKIDNLTLVDFDAVKRRIPDYHWKEHGQQGRDDTLAELVSTTTLNNPIILLYPPAKDETEYNRILSIANQADYTIFNIEITAPNGILVERYQKRLANIDPAKKHWKFKTLDEFKAKLLEPYFRPDDTISLDSSKMTPDEILEKVMVHLN